MAGSAAPYPPATNFPDVVHSVDARFSLYTSGPSGFGVGYHHFVLRIAPAVATLCRHVLTAGTPFAVHCAAGKDRAGMVVAVMLAWCAAVDEDVVARDYGASQDVRKCGLDRAMAVLHGLVG